MPAADHRLTTAEMALFVADGFLRFDGLVPDAINRAVLADLPAHRDAAYANFSELIPRPDIATPNTGTPLGECYPPETGLGRYLALPEVQGIIESLVGPEPTFDHDFVHHLAAGHPDAQHLHVDAIVDTAEPMFDIQLFYFPAAVEPGGGGTRFVPGTHLRSARAEDVGRYQHILGEQQYSGPAGTVLVFHHGMWHAGQANPSDTERWLYKIRLNPSVDQATRWNTDDWAAMRSDADDHIFANVRFDTVAAILRKRHPWQLGHDYRYDLVKRARLWRFLSNDATFDVDHYLTRLEQRPGHRP
ncbi:MAG: phytanoyl-CoA dioxygenase [Acidimicrobiales bacterium]|nr:phytanoyl-CoA dioxygenase [Acidimicrobiales bacterium]